MRACVCIRVQAGVRVYVRTSAGVRVRVRPCAYMRGPADVRLRTRLRPCARPRVRVRARCVEVYENRRNKWLCGVHVREGKITTIVV